MNKKRLLVLFLCINLIMAGLFLTAAIMINQSHNLKSGTQLDQLEAKNNTSVKTPDSKTEHTKTDGINTEGTKTEPTKTEPTKTEPTKTEPTKTAGNDSKSENLTASDGSNSKISATGEESDIEKAGEDSTTDLTQDQEDDSITASTDTAILPKLIYDSSTIDYKAYIPKMKYDSELEKALDITNPYMDIDAEEAILFDAETKKVLYYKNAVKPAFSASTLKLLTSLVALEQCTEDERVTVGDEITLIAPDSTKAYLKEGEVLTVKCLLEAMLLPSGNDAAYALAAYVGRKSLDNPDAAKERAITEFVHLMNKKAKELGVKNSCFKTPDGYDAIGQYTTAYDMGLIGMAAADNKTITEIARKSRVRTTLISGEDVTWESTNRLITRNSGDYYSPAIGLKTGTSTMAGKCLIAAAKQNGKKVVSVILNSTTTGRWKDTVSLLKYGLKD